jgi:hypothetical protein
MRNHEFLIARRLVVESLFLLSGDEVPATPHANSAIAFMAPVSLQNEHLQRVIRVLGLGWAADFDLSKDDTD